MSKAVKTIVAVAVVVAIPFVAPAISASIGLSAAIGSTAGSALVGAGLGAANAAITGGDVGRGALMGGIGGGIGGYGYTSTPTGGAPVYDYNAATNTMVPAPGYSTTAAATPGLSNVPTDALTAANATVDPIASLNASQNFTSVDPTYAQIGSEAATAAQVADAATIANRAADFGTPAQMAAAAKTAPMSFTDAIKAVPGELKAKFSDPKALADMTLRAAGSLAGSLSAGDGMSDQEKQLLQAQTDELRALQQSNKALFDQKLQAAQDLIGESKYFDPEYFGLQRARKAQLAGAKAKRAGLRGLEGSRRASEERRFDLATGRDTGTAFDQGFGAGTEGRLKTMQAGLTAMPGMQTGYGSDYKNIYDQYAAADKRSKERAQGIGDLFGSITGTSKARA